MNAIITFSMDIMLRAFWRSCQYEHRWENGRVLLTGATGYLGAFILRDLLENTRVNCFDDFHFLQCRTDNWKNLRAKESGKKRGRGRENFSFFLFTFLGIKSDSVLSDRSEDETWGMFRLHLSPGLHVMKEMAYYFHMLSSIVIYNNIATHS